MDPFLAARTGAPQPNDPEPGPDYPVLPTEMHVFAHPALPDDPALRARARQWLRRIGDALDSYDPSAPPQQIDLTGITAEDRLILDEILLPGEVNALALGAPEWQIEETGYAGLWRLRARDPDTGALLDRLEIGAIPEILVTRAQGASAALPMPSPAETPEGIVNAPHLLAELLARSDAFRDGGSGHVVNLGLLPLAEAEITWLVERLGEGPAIVISGGYGTCRIRSTRLADAWWVQYYNSVDTLILNSIEIATIPSVACAAEDDIADSADRVRALDAAYP